MPRDLLKEDINTGKELVSWEFPEFVKYQYSTLWYVIFYVVVVSLIIYSITTANILFIAIIIISAGIILYNHRREPNKIQCKITEEGLIIDHTLYLWSEIKHFWIVYEPPEVKKLYFEFKSINLPRLPIPLENQNPLDLRDILLDYIDEDIEREGEPISESLGRNLKIQ